MPPCSNMLMLTELGFALVKLSFQAQNLLHTVFQVVRDGSPALAQDQVKILVSTPWRFSRFALHCRAYWTRLLVFAVFFLMFLYSLMLFPVHETGWPERTFRSPTRNLQFLVLPLYHQVHS
jgi:hypothetical protein